MRGFRSAREGELLGIRSCERLWIQDTLTFHDFYVRRYKVSARGDESSCSSELYYYTAVAREKEYIVGGRDVCVEVEGRVEVGCKGAMREKEREKWMYRCVRRRLWGSEICRELARAGCGLEVLIVVHCFSDRVLPFCFVYVLL